MTAESRPGPQSDWSLKAVYALGFLTLIAAFNYLDRSLLGLALPDIKAEMHVSDTVLGLVSGLAFVAIYSVLGIPIAWAADRYNRRNIIAIGFGFWSVMTAISGFAANIWQLAAARLLMGAGEAAGLSPSASMISDFFRAERRALAMAIFGTSSAISGIIFFPLVGWIGETYGWRQMFIAAGVPGMLLALLFFLTVREPARGDKEAVATPFKAADVSETARFLMNSRSYLLLVAGATFMGANLYATAAWAPTFLSRVHGMNLTEIASVIGIIRGCVATLGILAGGLLIDRIGRTNPKLRARIPAIACFIAGPAEALYLLSDPAGLWMTGFVISSFFVLIYQGPIFALGVSIVRLPMRAVATSIIVFSTGLLGQVLGPLIVGALNDLLTPQLGPMAVRYSLLLGAVTPLLAGVMFWLAGEQLEADSARAEPRPAV
ncbi:MAG: MFS transporter [Parvularculaceae bacterium]